MEHKRCIEFPINIKITDEDISNIISKALDEGGSLHWCYRASTKHSKSIPIGEVILKGGVVLLHSMDGTTYELTRDKFITGLQKALPYLDNAIKGINIHTGSIDVEEADMIIQLALFNELIYD